VSEVPKFQIGDRVRVTKKHAAQRAARFATRGEVVGFSRLYPGSIRILRDGLRTVINSAPSFWEKDPDPPKPDIRDKFRRACSLLRDCTLAGFEIYVAGSGSVHLMSGPSHEMCAESVPRRDRILETEHVPKMGGRDR
jgi:hypothetical protein